MKSTSPYDLYLDGTSKVSLAIKRLRLHCPANGYFLAFSGGKDSIVVYRLAQMAGVKFDAHHNVTTIEPPDLSRFIKDNYADVSHDFPERSFWQLVIDEQCPPTRLMRYCCRVLKERGGKGRVVVTGVRHEESYRRSGRKMFEPCPAAGGTTYVNPIIDWTEQDVWTFIRREGLPYPHQYDEGYTRMGCLFCPYSTSKYKALDLLNYPEYAAAFVKTFQRMIDARKAAGKPCSWQDGADCFRWYVSGGDKKEDVDQSGVEQFGFF